MTDLLAQADQPQVQSIKYPRGYDACPDCNSPKSRSSKRCYACRRKRPNIPQPEDPTIRHIPLTRNQHAVVDARLYEWLIQWSWYAMKIPGKEKYYAVRAVPYPKDKSEAREGRHCLQTCLYMHRFILGVTDPEVQVDHKEPEETLNNTVANLRLSTASQNGANREKCRGVSGFKGVHLIRIHGRERWRAGITVDGVFKGLDSFIEAIDAARAYDMASLKAFGEFARTNLPREHYL